MPLLGTASLLRSVIGRRINVGKAEDKIPGTGHRWQDGITEVDGRIPL